MLNVRIEPRSTSIVAFAFFCRKAKPPAKGSGQQQGGGKRQPRGGGGGGGGSGGRARSAPPGKKKAPPFMQSKGRVNLKGLSFVQDAGSGGAGEAAPTTLEELAVCLPFLLSASPLSVAPIPPHFPLLISLARIDLAFQRPPPGLHPLHTATPFLLGRFGAIFGAIAIASHSLLTFASFSPGTGPAGPGRLRARAGAGRSAGR